MKTLKLKLYSHKHNRFLKCQSMLQELSESLHRPPQAVYRMGLTPYVPSFRLMLVAGSAHLAVVGSQAVQDIYQREKSISVGFKHHKGCIHGFKQVRKYKSFFTGYKLLGGNSVKIGRVYQYWNSK